MQARFSLDGRWLAGTFGHTEGGRWRMAQRLVRVLHEKRWRIGIYLTNNACIKPRQQSTWGDNIPSGRAALATSADPACSELPTTWVDALMGWVVSGDDRPKKVISGL